MLVYFSAMKGVGPMRRLSARLCVNITLLVFVLLLSGCMQKVKVTYVPSVVSSGQTQKISLLQTSRKIVYSTDESTRDLNQELTDYLKGWQGVRYRYGGYSTKGVDCSGLTKKAYKELYGIELPRTVVEQSKAGEKVDKQSLRPGDLVFFKTGIYSRHVGIYLGEGSFIHASQSKGVIQSSLNNSYWRKKYWLAKRHHRAKS